MTVLEISRLRSLVAGERKAFATHTPNPKRIVAAINECSLLGVAAMLTMASMELRCGDFPETTVFGKDGAADWTLAKAGGKWSVDPFASKPIRMSDRLADARGMLEDYLIPSLLNGLDISGSILAADAFRSVSRIEVGGHHASLGLLLDRIPVHSAIALRNHAENASKVFGIETSAIVDGVDRWYPTAAEKIGPSVFAGIMEEANADADGLLPTGNVAGDALWLRAVLAGYNRRDWPNQVFGLSVTA